MVPIITRVATLASGMPVAFEMNGTVREPAGVGLEHPHFPVADGELDVEQSSHPEPERQPAGQVDDPLHLVGGERLRRDDAGGVTRVDTGLLDMLHHSAYVHLGTVAHRVHVDLDRCLQEPVDQQRRRREADPRPRCRPNTLARW